MSRYGKFTPPALWHVGGEPPLAGCPEIQDTLTGSAVITHDRYRVRVPIYKILGDEMSRNRTDIILTVYPG